MRTHLVGRILRGALALSAAIAVGSCGTPDNIIVLTMTADQPVSDYYIQVYDTASSTKLLDTDWVAIPGGKNFKDQSYRIGLKVSGQKSYTVIVYGCSGGDPNAHGCGLNHTDPAPAGVTQFFFATNTQAVSGEIDVNAQLCSIPGTDDADRDWFPDMTKWPSDNAACGGAASSCSAGLCDCADAQVMTCDGKNTAVKPGDVHPFAAAICGSGVDTACNKQCNTMGCADSDGDGDPDNTDCAPNDPKVHHPITDMNSPHYDPYPESSNCCGYSLGKTGSDANKDFSSATLPGGGPLCHMNTCGTMDYDCDGVPSPCIADQDCDHFYAAANQPSGCSAPPNDPPGNDCNDCDPTINPGTPEVCGDKIDNNCNGLTDETCVSCDLDGDGYQRMDSQFNCPDPKTDKHPGMIDCDDEDAGIYPTSLHTSLPPPISKTCSGAAGSSTACLIVAAMRQSCKGPASGVQDVSCDSMPGEGCPPANCDADKDGFVDQAQASTCDPNNMFPHDCNDADATVFPGAPEKCGDNVDQNCNGLGDDACGTDADGDHYDNSVDCDENDPNTHPWATEVCDGKDNDCDGLTDEGNPDAQGNPMGTAVAGDVTKCNDSGVGQCKQLTGNCVCSVTDISGLHFDQATRMACPGETAAIDTGANKAAPAARCYFAYQPLPQSCTGDPNTAVDDDCDGRTDAPDGKNLDPKILNMPCWPQAVGQCAPTQGGLIIGCDSTKVNCFTAAGVPNAPNPWYVCDASEICPVAEKCNGFDDNCDGQLPLIEQDTDNDQYLACGSTDAMYMMGGVCESKLGTNKKGQALVGCGDCNDSDPNVHPGVADVCDAIDNDCSTATADGASNCPGPKPAMICCDMPSSSNNPVGCKDPTTDVLNCNGCNMACALTNATPKCVSSTCQISSCNSGFADCNNQAPDGCEINLKTDPKNCNACNTQCSSQNIATPTCSGGTCNGNCNTGFADCNNNKLSDGCEINTTNDVNNCASCGTACSSNNWSQVATYQCVSSVCQIATCSTTFKDCNGTKTDGCEINTATNVNNCGSCGFQCSSNAWANVMTYNCTGSMCGISACTAPFQNCNGTLTDGCETNTSNTVTACGGCSTNCNNNGWANVSQYKCGSSACGIAGCSGTFRDCNGVTTDGCEIDINSTTTACGACTNNCNTSGWSQVASYKCSTGACAINSCNTGFADCDGTTTDGCEVNTTNTVSSCGSCGFNCASNNWSQVASYKCASSTCGINTCNTGFADCNGVKTDGCEINTTNTVTACGGCAAGNNCNNNGWSQVKTYGCSSSACNIQACNTGFADCNGVTTDGCEINTTSTVTACGGCAAANNCNNNGWSQVKTYGCSSSTCTISACNTGFADCNGVTTDGCETNTTNTVTACGGCAAGNNCNNNGWANVMTYGCSSSTCNIQQCSGTFVDCDGVKTNGCECDTNTSVCQTGVCKLKTGQTCSTGTQCSTGACCNLVCTDTTSDASNCGGCGTSCASNNNGHICKNSMCECGSLADCNTLVADGCSTTCTCAGGAACNGTTQQCKSGVGCKLVNGQTCTTASTSSTECLSGICEMSSAGTLKCGAVSCTTTCQVINTAGTSCVTETAGQDLKTECSSAALCQNKCSGSTSCAAASASTVCGTLACNNTGCVDQCTTGGQSGYCDGTTVGSCPNHTVTCANSLVCSGTTCLATCSKDADCINGKVCSGTSCVNPLANGTACTRNSQCASNFCDNGAGGTNKCQDCQTLSVAAGSAQCSGSSPKCSTSNACGQCDSAAAGDTECVAAGLGNACSSGSGAHCTCASPTDCTNPRADTCSSGNLCVCTATGALCAVGTFCAATGCLAEPGFPCFNNTDCASGSCSSGICAKGATNAACINGGDCTSGTCTSFKCA